MVAKKIKLFLLVFICSVWMPMCTLAQSSSGPWSQGLENARTVSGLPNSEADSLLKFFLKWILLIFIILAFISFVVTGVMFLMAGTNKGMADSARSGVTYSIIAVAVAFSAYIIINLVDYLLRGGTGTGAETATF